MRDDRAVRAETEPAVGPALLAMTIFIAAGSIPKKTPPAACAAGGGNCGARCASAGQWSSFSISSA
jgi:hypothetical protein